MQVSLFESKMAVQGIISLFIISLIEFGGSCPMLYMPVCGSDGRTYSNDCVLRSQASSSNTLLTKVSDGPCGGKREAGEGGPGMECSFECPENYSPVCGSNWRTFDNECELQKANCTSGGNIRFKSRGICKIFPGKRAEGKAKRQADDHCNYGCNTAYRPVCGSDGKTYDNYCAVITSNCRLNQAVKPVSSGACPGDPMVGRRADGCPTMCIEIYQPVCGSDGKTYSNTCFLGIATCQSAGQVSMVSKGVCPGTPGAPGGSVVDPADLMVSKRLLTDAGKRAAVDCNKPRICFMIYDPVCASDGKTYSNDCEMNADCTKLTVVHFGPCQTDLAASKRAAVCDKMRVCPMLWAPVCGSDGKTYSNECAMNAPCNPGLTVTHKGPCDADLAVSKKAAVDCNKMRVCTMEWFPVCGSDGHTYSNLCAMNADCTGVTVANYGPCDADLAVSRKAAVNCDQPRMCMALWDPVCGSDGKTYSNMCAMNAPCTGLTVAHKGPCDVMAVSNDVMAVSKKAAVGCNKMRICPMDYNPVCGSDGHTYSNICAMNYDCTGVTVANYGPCDVMAVSKKAAVNCDQPRMCMALWDPVCGSDGKTYSNTCEMNVDCNPGLTVVHKGRC